MDQSAASRISGMDTPASAAAEVAAPLIEWALKMVVSIPALDRAVLIHLAMVALVAGHGRDEKLFTHFHPVLCCSLNV